MPIPLLSQIFYEGLYSVPFAPTILRFAPWALLVFVLRWYFGGSKNGNERVMHGKVIMVTVGLVAQDQRVQLANIIIISLGRYFRHR